MRRLVTASLAFIFWAGLAPSQWTGMALAAPFSGKTISLNGDWNFLADPGGSLDVQKLTSLPGIRPTRIPSSWQSQFADLRDYAGIAWYWRSITIDAPASDQVVLLRFGAVDYFAEVYVNGQKAGSHEGGYLPFELDVTSLLHPGENQIAVRVVDPGAKPAVVEGINYAEIPHGKQNWYVQTSGLWQDVEIDIRPRTHLGAVHITAHADGSFTVDVSILGLPVEAELKKPAYLGAEIRDVSDKVLWKDTSDLSAARVSYQFSGRLPAVNLWSLETPALYTLHAWLSSGDSESCRFGFRTLETRDAKFYLNGRPVYLRGALDQDFYPETIYTPPSLDYIKEEMRRAKALGLNLLRCHIKVPDPRYFEAADEVGILVWYEIPNWDKLAPNSQRRALETYRGMVERDWNHPSIVITSILNESWGANLKEAADRQWLKAAYQEAKKIVPGWLVDDNSPCCDNFHLATDIADFHQYAAIPDYAANFDRLIDDQARRPGWLFSPYGDAEPKGNEPLVLSEFGNWGLPRLPEDKPWWFSRDFGGREITRPEGIEQRFRDYRYDTLFPNPDALTDATEWHEYAALKYEIEALRSHPEMQGYVITEFTDINWEANGLLDMWRHPKIYAGLLSKLQQDDVLVLRTDKRNFTSGEKVLADAFFSHYSLENVTSGSLTWQLEGTPLAGSLPLPEIPAGSGAKAGRLEFPVPAGSTPVKRLLKAAVVVAGKTLCENSLDLYFYPPRQPELPPPVSFHDPDGRLRRLVIEMRDRNYLAPTGSEALPVMIASTFDDEVKKKLAAGGRVILIAGDQQTLAPGIEIVPRASGAFDGNWISNFLWVRKDRPPFTTIGFDTLAEFESQAATPAGVVKGIPPQNFNDVLAGIFYGWLHANVGTLVQAKYGKGILLICTYSLATTYGSDPYATLLLDAMVNYIVTGPAPTFEIPSAAP